MIGLEEAPSQPAQDWYEQKPKDWTREIISKGFLWTEEQYDTMLQNMNHCIADNGLDTQGAAIIDDKTRITKVIEPILHECISIKPDCMPIKWCEEAVQALFDNTQVAHGRQRIRPQPRYGDIGISFARSCASTLSPTAPQASQDQKVRDVVVIVRRPGDRSTNQNVKVCLTELLISGDINGETLALDAVKYVDWNTWLQVLKEDMKLEDSEYVTYSVLEGIDEIIANGRHLRAALVMLLRAGVSEITLWVKLKVKGL